MKITNLSWAIHRLTNKYQRKFITICLSSAMILTISACNEESTSAITDETLNSAETLAMINPADLGQHQTPDASYGPYGYRQPGYVNQDAYITENVEGVANLAYYGDWDNNVVQIIDVDNMKLLRTISTGDGPYGIDQQGPNKAYALTRRTESLTAVDNYTLDYDGLIDLPHEPRSTNFNANTLLSLVSGGDKAMTSIIRTDIDKVTKVIGADVLTDPHDFGGSLSTGHPLWISDFHFFMLNRAARQIQLWNRDGTMLSALDTDTSVHHIFQPPAATMGLDEQNVFYAVIEGNQDEQVSPGILPLHLLSLQAIHPHWKLQPELRRPLLPAPPIQKIRCHWAKAEGRKC